jgi:hypothetical protein
MAVTYLGNPCNPVAENEVDTDVKDESYLKDYVATVYPQYVFQLHDTEYGDFTGIKICVEDAVSAAIVAKRLNDDEYVKSGQTRYSSTENEDGSLEYVVNKVSNKTIIAGIIAKYPHLITDEVRDSAKEMIGYIQDKFTFRILMDKMNEFETSVLAAIDKETLHRSDIGVIAYFPYLVEKMITLEAVADIISGSKHFGTVKERISLDIKIYKTGNMTDFGKFAVNAFTRNGEAVCFFAKEEWLRDFKDWINVSGKISKHGQTWQEPKVDETCLNYVKVFHPDLL